MNGEAATAAAIEVGVDEGMGGGGGDSIFAAILGWGWCNKKLLLMGDAGGLAEDRGFGLGESKGLHNGAAAAEAPEDLGRGSVSEAVVTGGG